MNVEVEVLCLQGFHLVSQRIPHSFNLYFLLFVWWPSPLSLTTTDGVSVDFLSSRYLDGSVPLVLLETFFKVFWVSPKESYGSQGLRSSP